MVSLPFGILCAAWLAAPPTEPTPPRVGPQERSKPATAPAEAPADATQPAHETIDLGEALEVRPGATCIDRERLATQVRTWLDQAEIDARLRIEVVGDDEHALKLSFTLRRGDEIIAVRSFDPAPERCTDLHAVVGLAIALAIDATVLESVGVEPRPSEPQPKPPTIDTTPPARPRPSPAPAKPRRWRMRTDLTGVFTFGHPPGVGGGAKIGLDFAWREILELGVGTVAASSGREPVGDGFATFTVIGALAQICGGPPWQTLRPRGCVGLLAGAAIAAGQGFMVDQTSRVAWVDLPLGADLRVRLARRVAFTFGVDALVALVRPRFEAVDLQGRLVQQRFAPVGLAIDAGLSILVW